ncbi:hypothetical protein PMI16_02156 [Herbaspirillum sp. CF444]|nr:hypothetical protein [Herbaspirillum sp. CF444]EJL88512.1 hypothetical protein PMI16_02156 [Herbaspirillum sp. CF444]
MNPKVEAFAETWHNADKNPIIVPDDYRACFLGHNAISKKNGW